MFTTSTFSNHVHLFFSTALLQFIFHIHTPCPLEKSIKHQQFDSQFFLYSIQYYSNSHRNTEMIFPQQNIPRKGASRKSRLQHQLTVASCNSSLPHSPPEMRSRTLDLSNCKTMRTSNFVFKRNRFRISRSFIRVFSCENKLY